MHPLQEQVSDGLFEPATIQLTAPLISENLLLLHLSLDILISAYKTTTILIDGKRVKLQLWDTSGQGNLIILQSSLITIWYKCRSVLHNNPELQQGGTGYIVGV